MPRGSYINNILDRMLVETKRLSAWAAKNGTPQQRKTAEQLLTLHEHIYNNFSLADNSGTSNVKVKYDPRPDSTEASNETNTAAK